MTFINQLTYRNVLQTIKTNYVESHDKKYRSGERQTANHHKNNFTKKNNLPFREG